MGRAAERFRQNCPFLRHLRLKEITLTARKFLELSNFGRKLGCAGDCPQTLDHRFKTRRPLPILWLMKQMIAACFALCLTVPASAQEAEPDAPTLMERGLELFFEGLEEEMGPALDDFQNWADSFGPSVQGFMQEMGPALSDMMDEIGSWSNYHPPEVLPNGDIILRKKQPTDPDVIPEAPQVKEPEFTDI